MNLGLQIRLLREKHKESQSELAQKLGVSVSYLSMIEHGKRNATPDIINKIISLYPNMSKKEKRELQLKAVQLSDFSPEEIRLFAKIHDVYINNQNILKTLYKEAIKHGHQNH